MSMNVGLLNDSFPPTIDGVANCVKNYADIINKNHGRATVITPEYPFVIDNYPYDVYRYSSIKFKGRMPYRVGNPFSPVNVVELKRKNFDILHIHCPFAAAVLARNIASRQIPTVFTYHTKFDIDIDNYVHNKRFRNISKRFVLNNIKYFDEVWCVSRGAIESLRALGYKGDAIVMPNGTDFPKGKADIADVNEFKRMYKLDDSIPTLIFCGRMLWYKNIKLIVDGLNQLKKNGFKFKIIFVGDGPDRPAIEQYTRYLGMNEDYVLFSGSIYERKKVRAALSSADLLLFPSTYDTSGLVVKEAAACGCPSLLVKDSCAAEGIIDGVNGILIDESPEALASNVAELLKNTEILKKLGDNAINTVYFSWEDSVNAAYKRYEKIIENKNRKSR